MGFWPEDLDDDPTQGTTPKSTLQDAAKELEARTMGKVTGEVLTGARGDKLEHSFYLRATEVDYRYFLFKVWHQIAFEDALRELFAQPHTREVVNRLRNLAREVG